MGNILGIDWREAWIGHNQARKAPDDAQYWDSRAGHFSRHTDTSPYAETFIGFLAPQPRQSVLDVGCGGGTLTLPLARAGHEVFAVDFSPGMMAALEQAVREQDAREETVRERGTRERDTCEDAAQRRENLRVRTALLNFNAPWEEWEAIGITENCVDIALASRSAMVDDLAGAFDKLERAARVKVAVTMATEFGPRGIKRMGQVYEDEPSDGEGSSRSDSGTQDGNGGGNGGTGGGSCDGGGGVSGNGGGNGGDGGGGNGDGRSGGGDQDEAKPGARPTANSTGFVPDFVFALNLLLQRGRYPELRFIDSYKADKQGAQRLIRWAFISWTPHSPHQ
jgi:SAM-dependent methyltransferase